MIIAAALIEGVDFFALIVIGFIISDRADGRTPARGAGPVTARPPGPGSTSPAIGSDVPPIDEVHRPMPRRSPWPSALLAPAARPPGLRARSGRPGGQPRHAAGPAPKARRDADGREAAPATRSPAEARRSRTSSSRQPPLAIWTVIVFLVLMVVLGQFAWSR